MATTNHLGITLVDPSQSQKEVTVNTALTCIDAFLNNGAKSRVTNTPPSTPGSGDLYIVGGSPTGAWAGQAYQLAYFNQVWNFVAPGTGSVLWVDDESLLYTYNGTSWVSVAHGTVTSASVVSANGFAGTIATATSTPAITLSTSVSGVLKGNGTAISAATAGTDYSGGTASLATGVLKSTTSTGALSIAVVADFPALNQNTTGSAASLSVSGQTGLVTFTGITSANRAKTVRDAADTILELAGSYTPTGTWTNMVHVTPTLGAASATTINGNTFTTGTYTLTGVAGKTLTFDNSIELAGTDSTKMTFPSTSATIARTDAAQTFSGNQTIIGNIVIDESASSGFTIDTTNGGNSTTITAGSSANLTAGSGIVFIRSSNTGAGAIYYVGGSTATLFFTSSSLFVTPTTTPASGKACIAYSGSGSAYTIYNGQISTDQFYICSFRMGTGS